MINLMPPGVKSDIRFARRNVMLIQYCVLAAIISAALVGTMLFGIGLVSQDEKDINLAISEREASLEELSESRKEAEDFTNKVSTIGTLLGRELDFAEAIQNIGSLIPDGAKILSLSLDENYKTKPLTIQARIDKQETAAIMQQNFANSEFFSGADIQQITSTDGAEGPSVTTELVIKFATPETAVPATPVTPDPAQPEGQESEDQS